MALKDEKLDWFPFYHNRFMRDTEQWDDLEVGVYIKLLASQWRNGHLINDAERIRKITSQSPESFAKIWAFIGKKFRVWSDGLLRNDFLETVRKQQEALVQAKSEAGTEGARARWNKFIKPSVEEVKALCLERKNSVDPVAFFNFYESKDWMIGRNKMKNWKAAIATWERGRTKNVGLNYSPPLILAKPIKPMTEEEIEENKKTLERYEHLKKNPQKESRGSGTFDQLKKRIEQLAPKK